MWGKCRVKGKSLVSRMVSWWKGGGKQGGQFLEDQGIVRRKKNEQKNPRKNTIQGDSGKHHLTIP